MCEDRRFEEILRRMRQEELNRRVENLESTLPEAKEIIEENFEFDGSREGATLVLEGPRVSIYIKGHTYFLGLTSGYKGLYHPARSVEELQSYFDELNACVD